MSEMGALKSYIPARDGTFGFKLQWYPKFITPSLIAYLKTLGFWCPNLSINNFTLQKEKFCVSSLGMNINVSIIVLSLKIHDFIPIL